jgi:c-di-GMP-binding flagellar brake protein YcgR
VEKRQHERLVKKIKVTYTVLSKVDSTPFEFGEAVTVDISSGGLSLLVQVAVPVPSLVQLHLRMPLRPYGMFVLGKVVYCAPVEEIGMHRVGVKFVGLLPADLESALNEVQNIEDQPN